MENKVLLEKLRFYLLEEFPKEFKGTSIESSEIIEVTLNEELLIIKCSDDNELQVKYQIKD